LRKIEPSDLPFLYQWENDATSWADSDTHNPLSRHDLHQYIENNTGDIYRDGQLRLMIEQGGQTLGCIDLFDFDARNRKAAIGMYIAPDARGKGVGSEAVKQLLNYAFDFLHLRMVYAIISVNNQACSHIYEQLGFAPSSPLKDWTLEGDAILWQKQGKL
jgi:diamine N-acetyltransferase